MRACQLVALRTFLIPTACLFGGALSAYGFETPGAIYEFDAAQDVGGDATWTETGIFGFETLTFVEGATPTATQISDGSLNLFAHTIGADGVSNAYEQNLGGSIQASRRAATFEVWFKPNDLTTANQIIKETGGSGSGTIISLSNANLEFFANGTDNVAISTTLSNTNWHQVVGVINNTNNGTADDTLDLYLNGSFIGSSSAANVDDWAGGNQGGLGSFGGTSHPTGSQVNGGASSGGVDFNGALHLYRYYDQALNGSQVLANYNAVTQPAPEWTLDGDGNWSTAANWTSNPGVPGVGGLSGGDAILGDVATAPRTVSLNTNVNLGGLKLDNANGYTIAAGGGTLTMSGAAELRVSQGAHQIDAVIAGTSGLLKTSGGSVTLTAANTFSGGIDINAGTLSVASDGNLGASSNDLEFRGGTLQVTGTTFNTLSRTLTLTGGATIDVADAANTLNVASTLSGSSNFNKAGEGTLTLADAAAFAGRINVNGGTLVVDNASDLGTTTGPTSVAAAGGTLELDGSGGSLTIADNFTQLGGRFAAVPAPHIRSTAGNNEIKGNIQSQSGNNGFANVRLENAAEGTTLTIDNTAAIPAQLSDPSGQGRFVFQGTGNFKIGNEANGGDPTSGAVGSGRITGFNVDVVVNLEDVTDTVTIATAVQSTDTTNANGYYWGGDTLIESGTLAVIDDGLDRGELASERIIVREGARFDVSAFNTSSGYSLQVVTDPDDIPFNGDEIGQVLTGSGTIVTSALGISAFEDAVISPGDDVGTLNVSGKLTINQSLSNPNGALNYQLGNTTTTGGGVNDLIAVNGTLTLQAPGGQFKLNVTPVAGNLASTPYTIMTSTNNTGSTASGSNFVITLVNPQGTTLNSRQDNGASVSLGPTAVTVDFDPAAARTWTGSVSNSWDVGSTANWSAGDNLFFDLDTVTFGQSGTRSVTVSQAVTPGATTFSPTSGSYTFTGAGGIEGSGPVNVNSGTINLLNTGNNYTGTTTVAGGAKLVMASAATGSVVNNGTLSVGGAGMVGPNFVTTGLQLNYDAAQDIPGNGVWTDAAPAGGTVNLQFENGPSVSVAASDPTFQYLTAAYDVSSTGSALAPGNDNGYFDFRAQSEGTFEVVFNVTNTAAGNGQVLMDIGADRGVSLVLNGGVLSAGVNGDAINTTAFSTGTLSPGWHHAVVVIGDTDPDDGSNDEFTLYVDNAVVGTSNTVDIDDYSGSNSWGFGGPGTGVKDPTDGTNANLLNPINYHGQIALARYYQTAFDSADVNQNYLALQDPAQVVGPATLEVDGDFTTTSLLELDVFGNGAADLITATGGATLDGTIDVSLVGSAPANGTAFTILTALEGISLTGNLALPAGFTSEIIGGTDLVLTFNAGLGGDFNGDGVVNLADYTVWRDSLGATEDGTILAGNGNGGVVDSTDYGLWKSNFGLQSGSIAALGQASVPEPSTIAIAGLLSMAVLIRCRVHMS